MQENGIDKRFATGYDELAEGVETIGNFNNEWDIPTWDCVSPSKETVMFSRWIVREFESAVNLIAFFGILGAAISGGVLFWWIFRVPVLIFGGLAVGAIFGFVAVVLVCGLMYIQIEISKNVAAINKKLDDLMTERDQ